MRPSLTLLIWLGGSCAGVAGPAPVTPAERQSLEAERRAAPRDPEVLTRIGVRYYQGGMHALAREALTAAYGIRPSFTAAVYLGLSHEAEGHLDEAEASYRAAGSLRMTPPQRDELERRLATLARARLRDEARRAIAREAALADTPVEPGTIAVMPWSFVGADESLRPLGYGVAHLMLTDLAKIAALKLVERERVQVLLDELELATVGRVDPNTAARAGRLLRAERVVHGVVRQTRDGIRLEATVVRTADGAEEAAIGTGDRLDRLFTMEKAMVLGLVDQIGVPVSPAERREITERPVQDLQSFLALSRGLEAEARPAPRNASALARVAAPVAPTELAARTATLLSAIAVIAPSAGGEVSRRTRLPVSNPRVPEVLGQDNPSRIAVIGELIIIIPRP